MFDILYVTYIFGTYRMFGNNLIFRTFVPYLYMQDVPKLNVPNINVEIFGSEYMFRISIVPNILYVTYNMILSISLYIILTFIKFGNQPNHILSIKLNQSMMDLPIFNS